MAKAIEVLNMGEEKRTGRIAVRVKPDEVRGIIKKLKKNGFNHFVMLSCVDFIDDGEFELVYHMWSYKYKEHVMIYTRVPRDNPIIDSASDVFPQIETYEREIHELFGVNFEGNNRLVPFVLEGWPHMPPMRKDFDTEKFVKDHYAKIPEVPEK